MHLLSTKSPYLRELGPEVEDVLKSVLPVLLLVHTLLVGGGELARFLSFPKDDDLVSSH
jgi:hypothetical protein